MEENVRFMEVIEHLKRSGEVANYVQAAGLVGTNKAGINDIKSGKKKVQMRALDV